MAQAEREYTRLILKYVQVFADTLRGGLLDVLPSLKETAKEELPKEMRIDSVHRYDANIEKSIEKLFDLVRERLMKRLPDSLLSKWSKAMVGQVNETNKKNLSKVTDKVDVQIEPLLEDRKLTPFFQNIVDENVGLIKSIPDKMLTDVKNTIVFAISNDYSKDHIMKELMKKFGASKSRARLIARDQVNKLNGRLNQYRQQQIGGERYRWRTAGDNAVRGNPSGLYPKAKHNHWAREGKIFRWDDPPAGGHPGQDYQCRCHAEMVLEDILQ